jgi:hypothetical protein
MDARQHYQAGEHMLKRAAEVTDLMAAVALAAGAAAHFAAVTARQGLTGMDLAEMDEDGD